MSDRGVSETMGFVLVFALVTMTIGVVYATGVSGLMDAQHAEKVQNVERAFDVLADNLADLHRSGAPSRATEVKLAGGSLRAGEPITIEVRAENRSDASDNATYTINPEPIVYNDNGGTSIVYVGGAVLRSDPAGTAMLEGPGWVNGSDRSAISLVDTYGGSRGGVGGEGTILIVAEGRSRTPLGPFAADDGATVSVNVTVESPRVAAWKRFFEDEGFDAVDPDTDFDNVTYQFETETLYVTRTSIEVTFDR